MNTVFKYIVFPIALILSYLVLVYIILYLIPPRKEPEQT
jgi:phage shock protein PspC (stress-responsive transcriptional regulator)